jgi:hypothetical protein
MPLGPDNARPRARLHAKALVYLFTLLGLTSVLTPCAALAQAASHANQAATGGAVQRQTDQKHPPEVLSSIDHAGIALAVAAMSAQIGSIVVVFIAFAIQEVRRYSTQQASPADRFKHERDISRLVMLRRVSAIAMGTLLFCPILVAFGLTTRLVDIKIVNQASIFVFTFSILVLLLSLVAYLALESPFLRSK